MNKPLPQLLLVVFGFMLGVIACIAENAYRTRSVSTVPSASASVAHVSGPRVDWCWISAQKKLTPPPYDPLGPLATRWVLFGHYPGGAYTVIDDSDVSSDDMVALAKELGCPLHEAPSP